MAVMTGTLIDAGQAPMAGLRARLLWYLNKTTLHEGGIVVARPVEATLTGERFSVNVEPTGQGEYYMLRVEWLDPEGRPWGWTQLDRKIEVPEEGGDLSGSGAIVLTPDRVAVSLTAPTNDAAFWLQAAIGDPDPGTSTGSGDLYRRVD